MFGCLEGDESRGTKKKKRKGEENIRRISPLLGYFLSGEGEGFEKHIWKGYNSSKFGEFRRGGGGKGLNLFE